MILNHRNLALLLLFTIFIIPSITPSQASPNCNRSCGSGIRQKTLPFPFGFSEGCEVRLTCSRTGAILIGEFEVKNVTADDLFLDLPAKCNRSIHTLDLLFSQHYALTDQNGLLLGGCVSPLRCTIPKTLLETHFGLRRCNASVENVSCFSSEDGNRFLSLDNVKKSRCTTLFSSFAFDAKENATAISLEFRTVRVEWWLEGLCGANCSPDATCKNVSSPSNTNGFRCQCKPGFKGDGFVAGDGCRKVSSHCSPSRYLSGQCGGNTRVGVLIGGIIAGASLMAGLAFVYYCIRRRSTSLKSQNSTRRLLSEAVRSCTVPLYTYKEIEKATNGFSEKHRLGTGAYGTVYGGKFHNDEWVAIKKIRNRDTDGIEPIMNEIKLLSSVSHPNLVRLLGCCIERGEQILVYEFMPYGTLSQHLQRERGTGLPWAVRLTIATETAQAIAHLHSAKNPPIYHRDIKSSNILLDYNYKSKVADFGLSRFGLTETSHISTAPQGTPGYLDPQYHQNFHLSDKSDVYSFGVVLIEIITALKVVDFSRPHTEVNLAALAVEKIGKGCVDEIIDPFLEPHMNAWTLSSVHKVAELAFRCLAFHRDMRPSMMEVAAELENIRHSDSLEDNLGTSSMASMASICSSPSIGSEKLRGFSSKKAGLESRRLVVPQRSNCSIISLEEGKDHSPISVQDPWFSEQSSPSTNSLLDNAIN